MPVRPTASSGRRWKNYWPWVALLFVVLLWRSWPTASKVERSKHAYVLYATDETNLCNAYMVFEALHRTGSRADRVLLHNPQWATRAQGGSDRWSELLTRAQKRFGVKLRPVRMLDERGEATVPPPGDEATWDTSMTKLRAFELVEYERVLHLDSDILLQAHLDDLFLLPPARIAMPRAYWTTDRPPGEWPLTSLLMLLQPSRAEFAGLLETLRAWRSDERINTTKHYDMELLNHRFAASALVLPHRPYALLTAEFRRADHAPYLGLVGAAGAAATQEQWDARAVLNEARIVHFSDWPLPKPWIMWPHDGLMKMQPNCTRPPCRDREIWKTLYDTFRRHRKEQCGLLSMTAPNWKSWKAKVGGGNV
ncbi:glycosyltransferase family 8 protein [Piedraia hortae CBS 480.64]|uniref:Glycosyltransferase family 8 protein n=1 Tax=Piedraia hortae CBS 480.64 TaxID=1314780 RepID=A0A6A7BTB3_9PEZI|nr:glycosyltransferase family 8 protein [Piedraia hortae CBS 480.64]